MNIQWQYARPTGRFPEMEVPASDTPHRSQQQKKQKSRPCREDTHGSVRNQFCTYVTAYGICLFTSCQQRTIPDPVGVAKSKTCFYDVQLILNCHKKNIKTVQSTNILHCVHSWTLIMNRFNMSFSLSIFPREKHVGVELLGSWLKSP